MIFYSRFSSCTLVATIIQLWSFFNYTADEASSLQSWAVDPLQVKLVPLNKTRSARWAGARGHIQGKLEFTLIYDKWFGKIALN